MLLTGKQANFVFFSEKSISRETVQVQMSFVDHFGVQSNGENSKDEEEKEGSGGGNRDFDMYPLEFPPEKIPNVNYRMAKFSPGGCSPDKGTLLALVQDNYRVDLYSSFKDSSSLQLWKPFFDLSSKLVQFHKESSFNSDAKVDAKEYQRRLDLCGTTCLAWSPVIQESTGRYFTLLALGGRGVGSIWKYYCQSLDSFEFVGWIPRHESWASELVWSRDGEGETTLENLILTSSSVDGSVFLSKVVQQEDNSVQLPIVKTISTPDGKPVHSLQWNHDQNYLAFGKAGTLFVYSPRTNNLYRKNNAHSNLISGMIWMNFRNCLFTSSLDGTVNSWEFDEEEPFKQNIKLLRTVCKSSEEYHGLALSHNNLILMVVERVPPTFNVMYAFRKPYTRLNMISLNGHENDLEAQLMRSSKVLYLWDVLKTLEVLKDENRTFNIVNSFFNAFKSKKESLDLSRGEDVEQLARYGGSLRLANIVSSTLSDSELLSASVNMIQENSFDLQQILVFQCFSDFLSANLIANNLQVVGDTEALSLLLMADWVLMNQSRIFPLLLEMTHSIYENFQGEIPSSLRSRETCPFCSTPVQVTNEIEEKCSNGHHLERCSRTMLLISSPQVWNCCCKRKSLILGGELANGLKDSFSWRRDCAFSSIPSCPCCGGYYSLLRYRTYVDSFLS
eukprot:TRINITY_DN3868_c0_g1_i4.p1 TRINITY_DN3868_c0_g1~~TRINITY_DN3868_c0_g1_i4.p1  ORF type:complete len:783 (-),score=214.85 TRINITY_DN3868_c0_g1_i4:140-2161(-)